MERVFSLIIRAANVIKILYDIRILTCIFYMMRIFDIHHFEANQLIPGMAFQTPAGLKTVTHVQGYVMNTYIVLTAVGSDRPGLVDEISSFLTARHINIEDSRMAVLGGEFAVVLLASGAEGIADRLRGEISTLEQNTGLSMQIKDTLAPSQRKIKPSMPHRLTATSMDHPGIVHEITRILHQRNINIESMETRVTSAPLSGAPIFNMKCVINIPVEEKSSAIRRELEKLGDRMDIDIEIEAIDTFTS